MSMTDYLNRMLDKVAEHGHAVQFVGAGEDSPSFAYTVGLAAQNKPELYTVGLPPQVAQALLNELAAQTLTPGQRLDGVLVGDLSLYVIEIKHTGDAGMHVARSLYGDIRGLQIVYPDTGGRFPWEAGYDLDPSVQPLYGQAS